MPWSCKLPLQSRNQLLGYLQEHTLVFHRNQTNPLNSKYLLLEGVGAFCDEKITKSPENSKCCRMSWFVRELENLPCFEIRIFFLSWFEIWWKLEPYFENFLNMKSLNIIKGRKRSGSIIQYSWYYDWNMHLLIMPLCQMNPLDLYKNPWVYYVWSISNEISMWIWSVHANFLNQSPTPSLDACFIRIALWRTRSKN